MAHYLNPGDPDIAIALSFWGWSWAAAASVGESRAAFGGPVIRMGVAPEVPGLSTEPRAPRESVGCWPLAIITLDAIGGTPAHRYPPLWRDAEAGNLLSRQVCLGGAAS
jgi:hypothetical protein